jgi:hypothetical protein
MKDLEYLPRRLPCEDGRLRMIQVRGYWQNARWSEEPLPDGRTPAYRRTSLASGKSAYVPGFVIDGTFITTERETA